jgi:hypothetical protein
LFQPEKIGLQKLPEKRKGQTLKRLGVWEINADMTHEIVFIWSEPIFQAWQTSQEKLIVRIRQSIITLYQMNTILWVLSWNTNVDFSETKEFQSWSLWLFRVIFQAGLRIWRWKKSIQFNVGLFLSSFNLEYIWISNLLFKTTKLNTFLSKCCFSVMKRFDAGSGPGGEKSFTEAQVRVMLAHAQQTALTGQGLYWESKLMSNDTHLSE